MVLPPFFAFIEGIRQEFVFKTFSAGSQKELFHSQNGSLAVFKKEEKLMSAYTLSVIDPVQPYLLQTTARYYKYQVYQRGIQEFFGFSTYGPEKADEDGYITFRMVPDVGIQTLITCDQSAFSIITLEPDMEAMFVKLKPDTEYFGIRFIPGIVGHVQKFLSQPLYAEKIREYFLQERGFSQRCRIFQRVFDEFLDSSMGHNLNSQVPSIYAMVSKTNGDIRIDELSRHLGYSQRYMSKMIKAGFGMSPKTLCKYIKFQKSLEYLGYRSDMDITEVSNALGYYDQSHFVKYFKEFTGVTPRSYVSMVRQDRLYQKIETIGRQDADYHHRETFTPREWKNLFLAE